jgi:hypothetical protein
MIHYYADNMQTPLDYYKYFCDDFGELAEEGWAYMNVLSGCFIDGILYGDTTFATPILNELENYNIQYGLDQNYPNPFNSFTTILYQLNKPSFVNISILPAD